MTYFDPGNGNFVMIDGNIVERDALHIAEKIQDYDPDLMLICADPDDPRMGFATAPFLVIRQRTDGTYERVLEAWELDDRILERIWAADGTRNNQLDQLVKMERQQQRDKETAEKEVMGANHELFAAALANPKSSFSFKNREGDLVTVKDEHPVTYNKGRESYS